MTQTIGDFTSNLSKLPIGAGVDPELLYQFLNNRLQQMGIRHPWTRLSNVTATLEVPEKYDTGTIAILNGATSGTLTDGTFTAAMDGRRIRIGANDEFYIFTFVTGSTFTIDRDFEGEDETEATFRIWQAVFALPTDLDVLESISVPRLGYELDPISQEQLDEADASRRIYAEVALGPTVFVLTEDSAAGLAQVELWAGPSVAEGLPIRYNAKIITYVYPTDTTTEFPSWVSLPALWEGVQGDLYGLAGNQAAKQSQEVVWNALLDQAVQQDCRRIPPQAMKMAPQYEEHRFARAQGTGSKIASWNSESRWGDS